MKKSLAILLAVAMVFSMFSSLAFADAQTDGEYLNELGIILGDGTDLMLDGTWKKQDLAVLLSRLYGLEAEASATPKGHTFADVTDPFYDGFITWAVEEGLFTGVNATTFGYGQALSNHVFYAVILRVLGIDTSGANFNDTPTLAADAGFDVANVNWGNTATRGATYSVVVQALNTEVAGEKLGKTLGLEGFEDPVVPIVATGATVVTNNKVDVTLSAAATDADAAAATIAISPSLAVSAWTLSTDGKTLHLTTAAQTAYNLYTITVNGVSFNFVGQVADTAKPTITSVVALSNTTVKVTYGEAVGSSALNIANYSIAGLSVLNASLNTAKTEATLTTSTQTQGTIYALVITNVADNSGNVIATNSTQFGGLPADTAKPTITSVVATTNTSVQVTYNEVVNKATAENIANYTIAGLSVLAASLNDGGTVATLTTSAQAQGTIYAAVVANVTDISANAIGTNSTQFGGLAPDTTKPTITSVVALTNTSVQVTFNENPNKATAETAANYTIAGLTVSAASLNGAVVTLTTSAQTVGTIYAAVVANVTDLSGNAIGTNSTQFGGLAADTTAPGITSATSTGNTTVRVIFNESVTDATALAAFNYNLGTELLYPTRVTKISATTFDLTTAPQANKVYSVTINGVKDLSGNSIAANSKSDFAGTAAAADTSAPKVTSAVALNNNTLVVTFDKAIDNATIQLADFTYTVISGTETGTAIAASAADAFVRSADGKSVTLQFATETMTQGVLYRVTVATLSGTNGTVIAGTDNTANFAGINTANPAPTVTSAIVSNNQTLIITFSEAVAVTLGGLVTGDFTIAPQGGAPAFTGTFFGTPTLSADKKTLTVYYSGAGATQVFPAGSLYTVTVNPAKFNDELGLVALSNTSSANVATFAGTNAAATTPKISSIVAVDANTIDITFDQRVTSTLSSGVVGDLTVNGGAFAAVDVLIRTEGSDGNKLRVFFNNVTPFVSGTIYTINLDETKIINLNNQAMAAADDNKVFAAISTANANPSVVGVTQTSATTIVVEFSEIVTNVAVNGSDFTIGGVAATAAATSGKNVTLTFVAQTAGIKTLAITTALIRDEATVGTVPVTTSAFTFAYTP